MLYNELVTHIKDKTLEKPFAFPTETVFGIFVPVDRYDLIESIYEIKKRPYSKKLMLMFKDLSQIKQYYFLNEYRENIIKEYYLKKVSFICPLLDGVELSSHAFEIQDNIKWSGFRITSFKPLVKLLDDVETPLFQTSLNISGEKAITNPSDITEELRMNLAYVHDYTLPDSLPSTIVKLFEDSFEVVRQGEVIVENPKV